MREVCSAGRTLCTCHIFRPLQVHDHVFAYPIFHYFNSLHGKLILLMFGDFFFFINKLLSTLYLQKSSILGNFQFLYIDLIITASLAFTMGRQGPSSFLVSKRPSSCLLSCSNIIPLLLQIALCAAIQFAAVLLLYNQSW